MRHSMLNVKDVRYIEQGHTARSDLFFFIIPSEIGEVHAAALSPRD